MAGGEGIPVGNPKPEHSPEYHASEAKTKVTIEAFQIAKHLVTAEEFCKFLNSRYAKSMTTQLMWATDEEYVYPVGTVELVEGLYAPREGVDRAPANRVTWLGAVEYCRWLSIEDRCGYRYRLPSEAEWEVMARGRGFRPWPWGDEEPNERRGYRWAKKSFDYEKPWRIPSVGQYPAGATPEGVMDVMGYQLHEWCANRYSERVDAQEMANPECYEGDLNSLRVARGYYHRERERLSVWEALMSNMWHEGRVWSRWGRRPIEDPKHTTFGIRVVRDVRR